jgi:uncharacterized protein YbaR (Trm112 family)
MRTLWDLLACPTCRGDLARVHDDLVCQPCALRYPVIDGVPVLLPGAPRQDLVPRFQSVLPPRPGYSAWKERLLITSAGPSHAVLDFGCGYQALDDPRIVRMDACLHPYADVVGDVHALPFKDGSLQVAFGGAVFEHLRDPGQAAQELARVISPGGFVYADWNFVFAYHGYPAHYFNASVDGVREVFSRHLDIVEMGVAPFQGPGAALRQVIGTYLDYARSVDDDARTLRDVLEGLLLLPLEPLDRAIAPEDRHRIAAGVYVLAHKPGRGPLAVIPDQVWHAWESDVQLRARFPDPRRIAEPANILRASPAPVEPMQAEVFSKDGSGRPRDPMVATWPDALLTEPEPHADADLQRIMLARRRPWLRKLTDATARPGDLLRLPWRAVRWVVWRVQYARGRTP